MAKRGMKRDSDHPLATKNKKKHRQKSFVPLIQGSENSNKRSKESPNTP